jgi:hypothetical protein
VAQRRLARRAAHRAGPTRLALVAVLLISRVPESGAGDEGASHQLQALLLAIGSGLAFGGFFSVKPQTVTGNRMTTGEDDHKLPWCWLCPTTIRNRVKADDDLGLCADCLNVLRCPDRTVEYRGSRTHYGLFQSTVTEVADD